jgi:hypothetical protein
MGIARGVLRQLVDRRSRLRDLRVIGFDLPVVLALALFVIGVLERRVADGTRSPAGFVDERLLREFRLAAGYLGLKARDLQLERRHVGSGKSRIERRQQLARFDPLAAAHVDRPDDRQIERLHDDRRLDRHDLTENRRDHPIDRKTQSEDEQRDEHQREKLHRQAMPDGPGRCPDLRRFGLEAPNQPFR